MERYFNTEGRCKPEEHYMVRLDERLAQIKRRYIDYGKYFVINRGRQYGKTTTLMALAEYLKPDYTVLAMDFQMISTSNFANEQTFVLKFINYIKRICEKNADLTQNLDHNALQALFNISTSENTSLDSLFDRLSYLCETSKKQMVLMIDEVDSASNNQVFIDFLAQLRGYYLNRENSPMFHSVVLAGVYDIKNLKLKLRQGADHQYNSPWNIAAEFHINMNFSAKQIFGMLEEYESDYHIGMNITEVAEEIYNYTSGYPYLVSAICKYLDEELSYQDDFTKSFSVWSCDGIIQAVKFLLNERLTLFDSMMRQIYEYPDLKDMLKLILFQGEQVAYTPYNRTIELACMFGYVTNRNGFVEVANRMFETALYNLFLSEEELSNAMSKMAKQNRNQFISNGKLNMDVVMAKFVEYFNDIYNDKDIKFIEEYGRKFFLLYLKPIINGIGNYYIESQTRDAGRTDIIVDYLGEQFVIELKIWRGNEYNERGKQQLLGYLDCFHLSKGYLLSFSFNKNKSIGVKTIIFGDKTIVEAVV